MKKLLSLFTAVLFAGSMFATTVSKTVEELATANSWENGTVVTPFALDEVITVSTEATDANTGKYYTNGQQVRLYQKGEAAIIITAAEGASISSVTLTYVSEKTGILSEAESGVAIAFDNVQSAAFHVVNSDPSIDNGQVRITAFEVVYSDGGVTPPEPKQEYFLVGSVIGWAANDAYKLKANPGQEGEFMIDVTVAEGEGLKVLGVKGEEQTWFKDGMGNEFIVPAELAGDVTVYFRPEGNEAWDYTFFVLVKKEPVGEPTNCAEAAEAALSVSDNNVPFNDGKEYTIQGYVTEIAYQWANGSMSFWMADAKDGGKVLEAYKCAIENEADAVRVGDLVKVTGQLTKYNTTPEFAAGCTVEIIERGGEEPPVIDDVITCAQAVELANNGSSAEVTIEGYVTEIIEAWSDYKNVSFWMADEANGGQVFEAFRVNCENEADAPRVGDLVRVRGTLQLYNGTPEIKKGGTFEIIARQGVENTAATVKAVKVIRDGQVFILKGDKIFNVLGTEMK